LRGFEKRVLRRIFGYKREEVTGAWRRLRNEAHHDLHTSPNIIGVIKSRRMRWSWHVAHMREMRNSYKISVRKPEGKRPLKRPRHKCKDNIRLNCREIEWECMDWIHLTQDRDQWWSVVNMVMNVWVP
jgi:hypothetical protein